VSTTVDLHAASIAWSAGVWMAVGQSGTVARSIDRGSSWSMEHIDGASDLRGIASDDGAHVMLAVDAAGNIWSSNDAGTHFSREAIAPSALDAISIDDDGGPALAVGASGMVMMRDPIARTWSTAPVPFDGGLHAALVTSNGTRFYVAGDGGALFTRTTDAPNWSRVSLATTATLYGLEDL
jgi:hypothetical protein